MTVLSGTLVAFWAGLNRMGAAAVVVQVSTVKPALTVCTEVPVVIVTVREPSAAPEAIAILAVRSPELFMVTGPAWPAVPPPTAIPAPKLTFVEPLTQFVKLPVM